MKTAISIPDPLYESIESFLQTTRMTRSEFFRRAARLYLEKVSAKTVTASLDEVFRVEEEPGEAAFRRAALSRLRDILKDEEW